MRAGLLKLLQLRDELTQRFQSNVRDAVEQLTADDDLFRFPARSYSVSAAIQDGTSVAVFSGLTGQALTLPRAVSQGQAMSSCLLVVNTSANALTVRQAGNDLVDGGKSITVGAGTSALLVSDGVSRWYSIKTGTGGGGGVSDGNKGDVVVSGGGTAWAVESAAGAFAFLGVVSPPQIAANQNDYSPAGLSGAAILRISADVDGRQITGLAGGANGRMIKVVNVGTTFVTFPTLSGSSVAANQFDVGPGYSSLNLRPGYVFELLYENSKWRIAHHTVAYPGTVSNTQLAQMAANTIKANNTGATANAADITVAQALSMLGAFSGINIQAITATGAGTYTPTAGTKWMIGILTGAGGGGGGADCTGLGDAGAGAGGGAGHTRIGVFSAATIGASQPVSIGTGGTAGTAAGGNGGNGGNSTFGTAGALMSANGGNGGAGAATGTANVRTTAPGSGASTGTGGALGINGGSGSPGLAFLTLDATDTNEVGAAVGGSGGASFWGGGGRGGQTAQDAANADSTASQEAGTNTAAYGSGGGGGAALNSTTGAAGSAGPNGVFVAIEFT